MNETLSCITKHRLRPHQIADNTFILFYPETVPIHANNGDRFFLQVTQVCNAVKCSNGTFKAHTRNYSYVFSEPGDDVNHGIVSYHWHPDDFAIRDPHLHIRITPKTGYPEIERRISRAHFPTSRVCLEDFVSLLIKYYGIKSAIQYSQYRRILARNKKAFSEGASWTIRCP